MWRNVDDARTVDGNSGPVRDGAECRTGPLKWVRHARHPTAAASPAVFLCGIFISEEGYTNADSER